MRRAIVLLMALWLVAAPTVAGQVVGGPLTLSLNIPTTPIKPQIENPAFSAVVMVPCDAVLARMSPTDQAGAVVEVELRAEQGVVITGSPTILVDPQDCLVPGALNVTASQPFQLSIPRTAPGLTPISATGRARMAATPTAGELESGVLGFTVTADYYSVSQVKVASKLHNCAPCDHVVVRFEVVNYGNARTQYTFSWATGPGGGWTGELPQPVILDSPNTGQGSSTATVEAVVSGSRGEHAFSLLVQPAAADDPSKEGNPLTMNFLVRDTSLVSRVTPLPGGALVGVAALGLALLVRRRP